MRAAILQQTGQDTLDVRDDVEAVGFGPGRVRVRIRAASLCHSDLSAMAGVLPQPAPFVPGHEGAGEVVEVGEGVSGLAPGDRVVLCWMPPCGRCPACRGGRSHLCVASLRRLSTPGFRIGGGTGAYGFYSTGAFAEELVVAADSLIPVPADLPYELAALIGCGVTTGLGAVVNTARVEAGSTVAVIGAGGVGIAAVQAARISGAARITVVDPVASRRERALGFGATEALAPEQLKAAARALPAGGYDHVFEAVGRAATVRAGYDAARRGGAVVVIGAGAQDDRVSFSMGELFFNEKRLLPSLYGGGDVRRTVDLAVTLWRAGRLDLAGMITHRLPLARVNEAIAQMRAGEALRTVLLTD
ncbi:S-(hydroxymethyl)glutathione dehydrogenase/alcohol dehydrogenase [Kitasatospora sp. SolWspMP-SS2h]|uniref:alcohol dehydrogenase catalytic domain-containing protein n=1 Tax=Kitasatospora sp. SolWspMP-SS2h TaxID=1305729 RepID=UPI000DBA7D27|nr:alcohol dehydrogenase catalytic domain-containing protein [Kitasatospora sp. SolWspMP-SS2h]RAJ42761.1 S-(hydroxymethyl)glutathione dehydrogenase/alcohol dehydrogenase [Kitasatospora sp. SolWspMP-SS2h]